ncbi:MAG: PAS domain-containing protein [Chlamydiae bacterium]|nr:PAS domain-containing protein [Chlamydiota bacterium]
MTDDVLLKMDYAESVIEHASTGVITVDCTRKITHLNREAQHILGNSSYGWVGKDLSFLPETLVHLIEETLQTGRGYHRHEVKLRDGKHIGVNSAKIRSRSDEFVGVVVIFTDLSQIKNFQRQSRTQEKFSFISKIAQSCSHELKNCLVSIKTFSQLLPEKYMEESFRKDFYTIVSGEVDRLENLVDNFVFFSQPIELKMKSEDIREVLESSLGDLKDVNLSNIQIERVYQHSIGSLLMDRTLMIRALGNILRNSAQAMWKGGILTLKTKIPPLGEGFDNLFKEEALLIQIEDTGDGISEEHSQEIFEPFFSTKTLGMGLGLPMAKRIIEDHGGQISFTSRKGKGTCVQVVIPIRLPSEMPVEGDELKDQKKPMAFEMSSNEVRDEIS